VRRPRIASAPVRRAPVRRSAAALLAALIWAAQAGAHEGCLLPLPAGKARQGAEEAFQHRSLSASGFFALFWNSSGDSAFIPAYVDPLLQAFETALAAQEAWGAPWPIPLGDRDAYPVYMVPMNAPGGTSPPYSEGGVSGLTWIQLDHDPARWGGDPLRLLEVLAAHELFHARQFARAFDWRDLAFYEASAVWAEDRVHPGHDDWAGRYLQAWLDSWEEPLDRSGGLREYGAGAALIFLLEGEGGLEPLWTALAAPAQGGRCWPTLLATLSADPGEELLALAAERLRAGRSGPFRVPELATAPRLELGDLPAPAAPGPLPEAPPPGLGTLPELSLQAWRLPAGRLQLEWWPHPLAARLEGPDAPLQRLAAADTLLAAGSGSLLLAVNPAPLPRALLSAWARLGAAPAFRLWPDPGGRLRTVEFAGPPQALVLHDLLGRRLWSWTPTGGASRQTLILPGRWRGPLFLVAENGHALPLRHWP
jgi:hypothetical protein